MFEENEEQALFLLRIQKMREKMLEIAKVKGLAAQETIDASQELDRLLNEYYYVFQQEQSTICVPSKCSIVLYNHSEFTPSIINEVYM